MNTQRRMLVFLSLVLNLVVSNCGTGQLFDPALTPTPTLTPTLLPSIVGTWLVVADTNDGIVCLKYNLSTAKNFYYEPITFTENNLIFNNGNTLNYSLFLESEVTFIQITSGNTIQTWVYEVSQDYLTLFSPNRSESCTYKRKEISERPPTSTPISTSNPTFSP